MIETLGNLSLAGAVLCAAAAVLAGIASCRFASLAHLKVSRWLLLAVAVLMTTAAAMLLAAMLTSDFRFAYVASYTERALPVGYKLAAFWAGQEGSLLLWGLLLAWICVAANLGFRRETGREFAGAAAVMAVVCGFFAALLLFAANPFKVVDGAALADGRGLNPMLQDPAMIMHPPILFIGYAGFTVPFAVLVGVLIAGRDDNRWLASIRRWLLISWLFLGAGILLGAWWAYVELGWGGYWAWDPVENASLLPWLTSTALVHSIIAQQRRGIFKIWNASLIALTFSLCILGTYLTRSGVIDSVHAFASSPVGTFFLAFLAICVVGSIVVIVARRHHLRPEHRLEGLISREGAFLCANVLLVIMMLATLVGTIFPLLSGFFLEQPVTVKAAFYNKIVAPMAILLVGVMAMGPILVFGTSATRRVVRDLVLPGFAAAMATTFTAIAFTTNLWLLACVMITALGTFAVIVDFLRSWSARRRSTGENWIVCAACLVDKDHRRYGGQLVHLGIMMIVVGVAVSSLFSGESVHRLRPGESAALDRYTLEFVSLDEKRESNFTAVQATVKLTGKDGNTIVLEPQRRFYDSWLEQPSSEISLISNWREDVYLSLAGWDEGGRVVALQVKFNPLVLWIWIGGMAMCAGCIFCILPRLLPQPRRLSETERNLEPVSPVAAMPQGMYA